MSKKMHDAATRYPTHEKELLAVFEALNLWEHYLLGSPFAIRVCSDHRPLQYVQSQPKVSGRVARWMELLSRFDFSISYLPGNTNLVADALSRRVFLATMDLAAHMPSTHTSAVLVGKEFMEQLFVAIASDPGIQTLRRDVASGLLPDFVAVGDLLYRTHGPGKFQLVIPGVAVIKGALLFEAHDTRVSGHLGVKKTYYRLLEHFWWPRMIRDVEDYVLSCPECQASKATNAKVAGLLKHLALPSQPWK